MEKNKEFCWRNNFQKKNHHTTGNNFLVGGQSILRVLFSFCIPYFNCSQNSNDKWIKSLLIAVEQLLREEKAVEEPIWNSSLRISGSGRENPAATQRGKEASCLIMSLSHWVRFPSIWLNGKIPPFISLNTSTWKKNCSGKQQGYLILCFHRGNTDGRSCRTRGLAPVTQHSQHFGSFPPHVNSLLSLKFVAMSLL